jgi:hypothetical protein
MKRVLTAVLFTVLIMVMPTLLLAKGDTVKITIESADLAIEITDPAVRQFNIWSDFIIDSPPSANRVDAPVGLEHYKVSFYEGTLAEPSLAYVVTYVYDSSAQGGGFVYLPGGNDEFARLNMSHIYRGKEYEGHWFRSTKEWDDFVRPIIARAAAAH